MEIYKRGEAKVTRRVAFYSILLLSFWGFKELGKWLTTYEWARTEIISFILPVYDLPLSVGLALAIALNVVLGVFLFRYLNGPKIADLLIDTEQELKKVSWPSWEDARQSTIIVLIFVAATALYLTTVEFALKRIFDLILI